MLIINILKKCPLPVCYGDGKSSFLCAYQITLPHFLCDLGIFHTTLDHPHGKLGRTDSRKIPPWKGSAGKLHQNIVQCIFQTVLVGFTKLMGIHEFLMSFLAEIPVCPPDHLCTGNTFLILRLIFYNKIVIIFFHSKEDIVYRFVFFVEAVDISFRIKCFY